MEERLLFVARLLDGEAMTELCREFGISRKTGYKIFDRYKEHGLEALSDRSRRPVRYANQLPGQVESLIVSLKRNKPHWGARKIRELLLRRLPGDLRLPAKSTIHAVLDRHGLVTACGRISYGQKLERRKNLYLTGRSSLPERRVGATGSRAASAILELSIAARRTAESEFRIEPWACDHAAS